jgi:MoaA/NifB/PqqE/SkfB family radical SAM enzyme
VNLAVSFVCQSHCVMCSLWKVKPKDELRLDEIEQIAKKSPHLRWLGVTGGEPFLRKDLPGILQAFAENCPLYMVSMTTNSLTNHDWIEKQLGEILSLNIPRFVLTLSLDGTEEIHDFQRGVKGNYRNVMDLYGRLKGIDSGNLKVQFGYTMTRFNFDRLPATVEAVSREYPEVTEDDFHINLSFRSPHYGNMDDGFSVSRAAVLWQIKKSLKKRRALNLGAVARHWFLSDLARYLKTGRPPVMGRELDASYYVDSWGNVFPSMMWDYKLGSLRETDYDLMPMWGSARAEQGRRMIRAGLSPLCWTACDANTSRLGNLLP